MTDARAGDDDLDLKVRAAWLYHVEGLTQAALAQHLRVSRMRVVRLLVAARAEGIVHVSVDPHAAARVAQARALEARFGLQSAIVVGAPADDEAIALAVGAAAGRHLAQRVRDGWSIGLGWGATLNGAIGALGDVRAARLAVISLLGGMTHSRAVNPAAVARRAADALHADCYQLAAPLLVSRAATRDALWREPALFDLRSRARRSEIALVSVGDLSEQATLFREGLVTRAELQGLARAGAVGDVLCQFVDANGELVDHAVNRRAMTVGLDVLRGVRELVVASGGARKVAALRAALAALPVHVLVTDAAAAAGLLEA